MTLKDKMERLRTLNNDRIVDDSQKNSKNNRINLSYAFKSKKDTNTKRIYEASQGLITPVNKITSRENSVVLVEDKLSIKEVEKISKKIPS